MEFRSAFDIGRNLNHGIECLKRAGLPLFIGAFLMQCTEGGSGNFQVPDMSAFEDGDSSSSSDWDPDLWLRPLLQSDNPLSDLGLDLGDAGMLGVTVGFIVGIVLVSLVCGLVMFAFRSWLHGGYLRLHAHTLETGMGDFSALFSGSDVMLNMLVGKLLKGLIMFGIFVVAAIPALALFIPGALRESVPLMVGGGVLLVLFLVPLSIYFGLGLAFVEHAVTFDGLSGTAAVSRSFELAQGNRLHLFLFKFVYGMVMFLAAILGILMLCVGIIFTIPLARAATDVAFSEGYLLLTRPRQETERWIVWDTHPFPKL